MTEEQRKKLDELKREAFIKNLINCLDYTREEAEAQWIKINSKYHGVKA